MTRNAYKIFAGKREGERPVGDVSSSNIIEPSHSLIYILSSVLTIVNQKVIF
jgi:hypothetical protein